MKKQWIQAYNATSERLKIIIVIYLISVFLSMAMNLSMGLVISKNFTGSQAMETLLQGFDRTVFGDLLTNNENWSGNLYFTIIISMLLFIFISVLVNAVYIYSLVKPKQTILATIKNGSKYFFPFLGFALMFYLIVIILAAVIGYSYIAILGDPAADYKTELPFVYSLMAVLFIFFLLINFLWILSLQARRNYIEGNLFLNAIRRAVRQTIKKIPYFTIVILLIWLVIFILFLLMKEIHKFNSASSWCKFILAFSGMQILVFLRIWLKYYFMGFVIYRKTEPIPQNQSLRQAQGQDQ